MNTQNDIVDELRLKVKLFVLHLFFKTGSVRQPFSYGGESSPSYNKTNGTLQIRRGNYLDSINVRNVRPYFGTK